jgi:glycine oxidase
LQTESFDVAVIGAGVCGLSVAWRAAQAGASVVVLDRGPSAPAATHVAAGMLAPVSEADPGELELTALGIDSGERWPAFAAELLDASGIDPGYRTCGSLLLARDRDEDEALERELALRGRHGLQARRLLPSRARELEPSLAPALRGALDIPGDHAVDPRATCAALRRAAELAGADIRTAPAPARIELTGDRASGVRTGDGPSFAAGQVVVAAGAWSGQDLGLPEAARVPVRPVKGQTLRLRDPQHRPARALLDRVVRFEGGYLVPRGDGRYVLGATVEERGFDTTITALGLYELLRDASELVPGLLELVVEETLAGLRPGTPDNAPLLGPSPVVDGLHWATGHYRNGILLAPVTGELVAGALAGTAAIPSPFAAARVAGAQVPA